MKRILFLSLFILVFFYIKSQNIVIDNKGMPNEPSIIVNPNNPNQLVAGSNTNNCYYSHDGGYNWTKINLTSTYGVYGDPCITTDKFGHFYFFHLSNPDDGNWVDRIVCQKSEDGGKTWNNGSFTGLNGNKVQDKHWVSVDKKNNFIYTTWTQFDAYESKNTEDSSLIMFSRSEDAGKTWSEAIRISQIGGDCLDNDYTVEGAVPAVGPQGQIYVAWAGRRTDGSVAIIFDKSYDFGKTWLKNDIAICDFYGGWTYDIPGIYRANGMPVLACDTSGGPNNGTIYINWSDKKNGETDTDIWIMKSTDEGETWTEPKRVNDDAPGKYQFFTWMTIDPITGFLYIVFYDRRNYEDNNTDVYLAYSTDSGETFVNNKISNTPFLPNKFVFFGDYSNISAFNGKVYPIWARADGVYLSVLTDVIDMTDSLKIDEKFYDLSSNIDTINKQISLNYIIRKKENVSLSIVDSEGKLAIEVITPMMKSPGKYTEAINYIEKEIDIQNCFWKIRVGDIFIKHKI